MSTSRRPNAAADHRGEVDEQPLPGRAIRLGARRGGSAGGGPAALATDVPISRKLARPIGVIGRVSPWARVMHMKNRVARLR